MGQLTFFITMFEKVMSSIVPLPLICSLMPQPYVSWMTQFVAVTLRIPPRCAPPERIAAQRVLITQLAIVMFSTGSSCDMSWKQMASSSQTMLQSEMCTLRVLIRSMPSLLPLARL